MMKTRTIILGILTLIVGFLLGMLTSAQVRLHRLRPVRMYASEERFREGFYKVIQPDENQKIKIDQILDKYARLNSETQSNFRKEFEANRKAMRKELDSNLTKDQIARLKQMDEKRQEMMRQARERRKNDTANYRNIRPGSQRHINEGQDFQGPPPPPFPEGDTSGSARGK
jgi:hypothetical protein